jgi:predicted nucleic acid-binding protein
MEKFVVDANVIISLFDLDDSCHLKAIELIEITKRNGGFLLINNVILYEILTVLARNGYKQEVKLFYQLLWQNDRLQLIYCDKNLEKRAFFYFNQALSKNISFFDCTIFATAEQCEVKNIISFDKQLKYIKGFNIINDPKQLS